MNKSAKIFLILFNLIVTFQLSIGSLHAQTIPVFPSCVNPSGALIASYDSGTHGIVGDGGTYQGSDRVYKISDDNLVQCFCPSSGSGIQTNWLKISGATQPDISILESQGWTFVPTGVTWGLEDVPYVTKNISFSCVPTSSGGGSSTSSSNTLSVSTEKVGQVLGLAATGTSLQMLSFAFLGVLLTLLGIFTLPKHGKNRK